MAPVPFQSCVGAIANRGQWEQGCSLFMATDLGPVRATSRKKKKKKERKKVVYYEVLYWNMMKTGRRIS